MAGIGDDKKSVISVIQALEQSAKERSAAEIDQVIKLRSLDKRLRDDLNRADRNASFATAEELAAYKRSIEEEAIAEAARIQRKTDEATIKAYYKEKDKEKKKELKNDKKAAEQRIREADKREAQEKWDESGGFAGALSKTFSAFQAEVQKGFTQNVKETGASQLN